MKKTYLQICLALSAFTNSYALEPLTDSSETYNEIVAKKTLASLDTNKDGLFTEKENPRQWKSKKRSDTNGDGALDLAELSKTSLKYVESPGKQIRNVLFKKTTQGGVYLDIYMPDEDKSTEKPVVLYTHGGAGQLAVSTVLGMPRSTKSTKHCSSKASV